MVSTETSGEFVRTMKANGRVLQYKAPITVQDSLSGHEGQYTVPQQDGLNEQALHSRQPLHPDSVSDDIRKGENRSNRSGETKDLSSSKPAVSCVNTGEGVVRVKLVIRKQELAKLLSNGLGKGATMEDILVELQGKGQASVDNLSEENCGPARMGNHGGWKPALESIPEYNTDSE